MEDKELDELKSLLSFFRCKKCLSMQQNILKHFKQKYIGLYHLHEKQFNLFIST